MQSRSRLIELLPYFAVPTALGVILSLMMSAGREHDVVWLVVVAGVALGLVAVVARLARASRQPADADAEGDDAADGRVAFHQSPLAWLPVIIALALVLFYLFS